MPDALPVVWVGRMPWKNLTGCWPLYNDAVTMNTTMNNNNNTIMGIPTMDFARTTQKFLNFLASLDETGKKVMNIITTVDTGKLLEIVDALEIPSPLLDLNLAIPTETGYNLEIPRNDIPVAIPVAIPTTECPICFNVDDSHLQCPNGHTASCLDCLSKMMETGFTVKCPICRKPLDETPDETADETADETDSDTDSDTDSEIDVNDIMDADYDTALNEWRQSHFNQLENDEMNPTAVFNVDLYETPADRRNNMPARRYEFSYEYTTPQCYVLKSNSCLRHNNFQPAFLTKAKSFFRNFPHTGKEIILTESQRSQTGGLYIGRISLNYDAFNTIHTDTYGY